MEVGAGMTTYGANAQADARLTRGCQGEHASALAVPEISAGRPATFPAPGSAIAESLPRYGGGQGSYPDAPDWDYFRTHTYDEMANGH